jgi:nucleotide sugar dehydrogenase
MIKIGISGLGFVGNALHTFFNSKNLKLLVYDKYKNINDFDVLLNSDLLFICLPTQYDYVLKKYDMTEIDLTIYELNENNYDGIIIIKSTTLPDYCTIQNNKYPKLKIMNNPEFLSARTAIEDFANQKHIIIGTTEQSKLFVNIVSNFYNTLFPLAKISITTSTEASITKLGCNSFYATKVQYFTELYLLCEKLNISYDNVKNMMLMNDWINPMHTQVPGQDNNISFGGACLPKDISALTEYMNELNIPNQVVKATIEERNKMRQ